MKIQLISRRNIALTLGAMALFGGALAVTPAQAQDAGAAAATTEPTKPISLNLVNVPVRAALQTLFSSAGIKNYSIRSEVQGFANINVSEVPFSLALRQLLQSVNPPLDYTVDNGTWIVSVKQAAPPPAPLIAPNTVSNAAAPGDAVGGANTPKRFYRIPIDKYDAYEIAQLVGATGIVKVGVNEVIPASGGGGQGGGGGFGQGGQAQSGGFGQGGLSAPVTSIGGNRFGGGNNYGGGNRGGGGGYSGGGFTGGGFSGGFAGN